MQPAPVVAAPVGAPAQPMQMQGQPGMEQPMAQQPMMQQPMGQQPMMQQQPMVMGPGGMMVPMQMPLVIPVGDIFGPGPLLVEQHLDLLEVLVPGYEQGNKYNVKGALAGPMFMHEESSCLQRQLCKSHREADVYLRLGTNDQGPIILRVHKNMHCGGWFDMCCRFSAEVYDSNDKQIGKVYDDCLSSLTCKIRLMVQDPASNENVVRAEGCCCQIGIYCPCCADVVFDLSDEKTGNKDGNVTKKFGGMKECLNGANNFEVNFPAGADENAKAMYVGLAICFDFLCFEDGEGAGGGD